MESQITIDDLKKIEAGINEKYAKVATSPEGQFKYPTGSKGFEALNYDKALTEGEKDNPPAKASKFPTIYCSNLISVF